MAGDRLRKKYTHQFVLAAIIILGGLILFTMRTFIDAFLGAVTLYVLFRPMMRKLVEVRKWPRGGAAVLILFLSFLIVLIPLIAITYMIVPKVSLFFLRFFGDHVGVEFRGCQDPGDDRVRTHEPGKHPKGAGVSG